MSMLKGMQNRTAAVVTHHFACITTDMLIAQDGNVLVSYVALLLQASCMCQSIGTFIT